MNTDLGERPVTDHSRRPGGERHLLECVRCRARGLVSERVPVLLLSVYVLLIGLSRVWMAVLSSLRPFHAREHAISVWPPKASFAVWFERIWFAPAERWDVASYIKIASVGYRPEDGTTQFHPLFGLLARPFVRLGMSPLVALSTISFAATLVLLFVFYELARRDLDSEDAAFATLALLVSPV